MSNIEFKNESGFLFAFAEYDKENNWIFVKWIGFPDYQLVKKFLNEILLFIDEKKVNKYLVDNRDISGAWSETASVKKYIKDIWLPKANKLGIKYMARIHSKSTFLVLNTIPDNIRSIESMSFEKLDDAKNWLKKFQTA